jgi:signal transduction histidine kinase
LDKASGMNNRTQQSSTVLQGVVEEVLSALALALGARRAAAFALDDDTANCCAIGAFGLTEEERERVGRGLTIDDTSRPYWTRLVATAGPLYLAGGDVQAPWRCVGGPVPSHLAVPLVGTDGVLRGAMLLEAPEPGDDGLLLAAKMARVAAIAMEQTHAAEERAEELTRNTVLLDIVREVDRQVELPQVLAAICQKTAEAFAARQVTVYLHSRRHRGSLPLADYGTPPQVAMRFAGGRYMKGQVPHEAEVQTGRTVIISRDDSPSEEDVTLLDLTEVHTLVFLPLRDEDGTVRGLLSIGFETAHVLKADALRALEMVARHAAMAITRARFLDRTAKAAQFRAGVASLAVELNAATSRSQTLQLLCSRGSELFGVDSAALLVEAGGRLVAAATHGNLDTGDAIEVALDDGDSTIVRAVRAGEVVLENDRPRHDDGALLDRMRSRVVIPLIEADGTTGAIIFGELRPRRLRPWVAEEAPVLGALAVATLRNLELMGQVLDSNQRLGRLSALKDQFLANVSHDLRTPLNVIIGFAQLALEDTFGEPPLELRGILERMLASARQQLTLVQDLLDVSRLELSGLTVKSAPIALAPLFADMEFLVTSLVRHKPVRIVMEAPEQETWVLADPDRIRQILTNLLANAAKFTDAGTITLRAAAAADAVRIDVIDSGIGIPADQLSSIFEPFRQVEGERAALGTGLGLAIAQRLASLMQGTLSVESTLGRGSTFTLTVPSSPVPAEPAKLDAPSTDERHGGYLHAS